MASISLTNTNNITELDLNTVSAAKLGGVVDISQFTNIEKFKAIDSDITAFIISANNSSLISIELNDNNITTAAVNTLFADLVDAGNNDGILNLDGAENAAPTGQGLIDKATLVSRGWNVTTN